MVGCDTRLSYIPETMRGSEVSPAPAPWGDVKLGTGVKPGIGYAGWGKSDVCAVKAGVRQASVDLTSGLQAHNKRMWRW